MRTIRGHNSVTVGRLQVIWIGLIWPPAGNGGAWPYGGRNHGAIYRWRFWLCPLELRWFTVPPPRLT